MNVDEDMDIIWDVAIEIDDNSISPPPPVPETVPLKISAPFRLVTVKIEAVPLAKATPFVTGFPVARPFRAFP